MGRASPVFVPLCRIERVAIVSRIFQVSRAVRAVLTLCPGGQGRVVNHDRKQPEGC